MFKSKFISKGINKFIWFLSNKILILRRFWEPLAKDVNVPLTRTLKNQLKWTI